MRPPERTRIRVSPGAPALLAVFVWLSSPEVLGAVLLAALANGFSISLFKRYAGGEDTLPLCGYQFIVGGGLLLLTGLCFGGTLPHFTGQSLLLLGYMVLLSAVGAEMQVAGRMSYGGELLAAAAGPAVNLLLAAALGLLGRWWEPLYLLAGAQAVLGCFNLLPILPLDGGRMLWLALCWGTDPFLADRVTQAVSLAAAGLLTVAGAALARRSPFLLWTAAALLVCAAAPCIKRRRSVYASHKGR